MSESRDWFESHPDQPKPKPEKRVEDEPTPVFDETAAKVRKSCRGGESK